MPGDQVDPSVPASARIWNYWLGGHDNFPVDREVGDRFLAAYPDMARVARAARGFLTRTVSFLAGEVGLRQFLDVGSGLPTADNTHQVAQRIAPATRIVYVDHDPMVTAHARDLLTSHPDGRCAYVEADARDPETVVEAAAATLDFGQPIALMVLGVMGHVQDDAQALAIVQSLVGALPSGSYLTLSDGASTSAARNQAHDRYAETGAIPYALRRPDQIRAYFDGLDVVPPGVVPVSQWRPAPGVDDRPVDTYGGVGRKL